MEEQELCPLVCVRGRVTPVRVCVRGCVTRARGPLIRGLPVPLSPSLPVSLTPLTLGPARGPAARHGGSGRPLAGQALPGGRAANGRAGWAVAGV